MLFPFLFSISPIFFLEGPEKAAKMPHKSRSARDILLVLGEHIGERTYIPVEQSPVIADKKSCQAQEKRQKFLPVMNQAGSSSIMQWRYGKDYVASQIQTFSSRWVRNQ